QLEHDLLLRSKLRQELVRSVSDLQMQRSELRRRWGATLVLGQTSGAGGRRAEGVLAPDGGQGSGGLGDRLEAQGRRSLATSETNFVSKVRKLTNDASFQASAAVALAAAATSEQDQLQYTRGALNQLMQVAGVQQTALEMANMLAKGFKHATAAKVIAGPPEQRELVGVLTSMSDEVAGAVSSFFSAASKTAATSCAPVPAIQTPAFPAFGYQGLAAAAQPVPQMAPLQLPGPPAQRPVGGDGVAAPGAAQDAVAGRGFGCHECGARGHGYTNCPVLIALSKSDPLSFVNKRQQHQERAQADAARRPPRGPR
ncbi:hypothetical protein Agub_g3811, partial [Astrephomene gubernaculifera]